MRKCNSLFSTVVGQLGMDWVYCVEHATCYLTMPYTTCFTCHLPHWYVIKTVDAWAMIGVVSAQTPWAFLQDEAGYVCAVLLSSVLWLAG